MPRRLILILCASAAAAFAETAAPAPGATPEDGPAVVLPSGARLTAEVVTTPEDRARGLMFRRDDEFPEGRAMVFLFEEPEFLSFWMKNMNFAIDMVWLGADGRIVHIEHDAPPCHREPCAHYQPMQKAQTVIELHRGTAAKEGLAIGDVVKVVGADGAPLQL